MNAESRHRASLLALSLVLTMVQFSPARGEDPRKKDVPRPLHTAAVTGSPQATLINVGNITSWLWADGGSNRTAGSDANGCYFPRGTSSVVFSDGLVWGGKVYLDAAHTQLPPSQLIRVGGQTYYAGTQGGSITGRGAGARPVDPAGPGVRVYRIRRTFTAYDYDYFGAYQDAAEFYERNLESISQADVDSLLAQYRRDWAEWPVQLGAPYIERNGIPGYQPPPKLTYIFTPDSLIQGHYDEPGVAGADLSVPADQVLWTVANDLDDSLTQRLYGSNPIGIELQITRWAYRQKGALANSYFTRHRLINKGGVDWTGDRVPDGSFYIDSMYLAQWSDPDIGVANNDLCGCDPGLDMGFAYNGYPSDAEFSKFSLPPPAIGYDFLQGPIVPSPGDTAAYDLGVRPGFRNLPMTSFAYFGSGEAISEPPPILYESTLRWWKMLRGYVPDAPTVPDRLYSAPPGSEPTFFPLSGDPLTRHGFVDGLGTGYSLAPGDRRIVMNTGPFRFAPGDTQEVVIGTLGGLGADNLTSVSALKFTDRFVQSAFDRRLAVPLPPSPPHAVVTERDREIILDWGSDLQRVREIEGYVSSGGHAFEGYEVYRLPSRDSPRSEWVHLVTLDLNNGLRAILDEEINPETGLPALFVSHRGNDTGIQRFLRVLPSPGIYVDMRFPVTAYLPGLVNGEECHFALTAYSYSRDPGTFPRSLESDPVIVTARPKIPFGREYSVKIGDTLAVTHVGASQAIVTPILINPDAGTGDTYEVRFDTTAGSLTWILNNITRQTTVIENLSTTAPADQDPIVAGVQLNVITDPGGMTNWRTIPYSYSPSSGAAWSATNANGLNLEGFGGSIGNAFDHWPSGGVRLNRIDSVLIFFAATDSMGAPLSPTDAYMSMGYRYLRNAQLPAARPEFAPLILRPGPGYAYQDYRLGVPFAAYAGDTRLEVGFLENNVPGGRVDGRYFPPRSTEPGIDNTSVDGPMEWFFIFNSPYSGPNPNALLQCDILSTKTPIMWFGTPNRRVQSIPGGYQFVLYSAPGTGPSDVFQFTIPTPLTSPTLTKASVNRIGVYPNPYYGGRSPTTAGMDRRVTFTNLPLKATLRIYNLVGHLVRTLEKNDVSQFLEWNLQNDSGWLVASGMYIVHVEMPEIGANKILKMAIIQEAVIPPVK